MNARTVLRCSLVVAALALAGCQDGDRTASNADTQLAGGTIPVGGDVKMEKATFAAGCFWGVEATFRKINGVVDAQVGYTGGKTESPTYRDVCSSDTGHAEAVEVTFDPAVVSYDTLLDVFWNNHNPTQRNRQGPDYGSQYRSAVFYHTPEQQATAEGSKQKLDQSGKFKNPVVTQIVPAVTFYRAEEYHQRYLEKQGLGQCHVE